MLLVSSPHIIILYFLSYSSTKKIVYSRHHDRQIIGATRENIILGAISTDECPGDEYPKAGHPSLQTTERPATELNDLYDVLDKVNEKSERNKSKQGTLAAYRRTFEEPYTFYANESNKWDPLFFDSWAWSLKHLVIDHILQV